MLTLTSCSWSQLHWNMIRLEGAEVLCNSLRTNRILTNLDLSYNALGSAAAGVLGAALMENSVSAHLHVVVTVLGSV
jgi:hypothetical protein